MADGILTRKQLRSSAWVRLRQDVYADVDLPITHRVRTSAVGLVLPDGAGFGGRSAAGLWGVTDLAGPADPVEVLLPEGVRWNAGDGVRCRSLLPSQQLVRAGRWRATSPVDTAVDILRFERRDEAVVVLDHLVHEGMVTLGDVRAAVRELPPCFGAVRAREAASRADGLAESRQETRLRLLMLDAGLPPPVAQFRVRDDRGYVARLDFAYPELRLAIEYDGLWHAESPAVHVRSSTARPLVGGRMDGAARDRRGHAAAGAPRRPHPRGDHPAPGEGRGTLNAPTSTT